MNNITISLDKMHFTIINHRPEVNEKQKSEIEAKLFDIFKKYV